MGPGMVLKAWWTACVVALSAAAAPAMPPRDGLVLWLDAGDIDGDGTPDAAQANAPCRDSAGVAAWQDKSGSGHRATQPATGARPTYVARALGRRPAVRFDGGDFLNLGQAQSLSFERRAPFTIAAVYAAAGGQLGTLIAKGGGTAAQRAYQFYVTGTNLGAVAYGAMRETRRSAGAKIALQVCSGSRCDLSLNGEPLVRFAAGRGSSRVDTLVGARRKTADNKGTYYALRGDIAELLVYRRALGERDQAALLRHLGAKYGLPVVTSGAEAAAQLLAADKPLEAAERLWRTAQGNRLGSGLAATAGKLLAHPDPFVRGIAEWALAMKVGGENNGQEAVWPRKDPPAWFTAWSSPPPARLLEGDYVRQAVARGLHRSASTLLADVEAMCERAARMAADFAPPAARLDALRMTRDALAARVKAAPADLAGHRRLWLDARRAMRRIAMANPAIDFDKLVFVKQFAPHTVRNITRSYQWKHKPGGDICVLTGLRPDGTVRPLIQGRLGRGFAWGLDLWWDADRVVFGYARQPVWPPAVDTARYNIEGQNVFELRKTHPPMHIYEVGTDGARLRQLTDHAYWNDFEPTYCANGDVVFASDRCGRSAQCGSETYDHMNPNLYIASPDGKRVRQLTDNKDIDRYPHSLADGRIAYTHWEYQERHFMEVHSLWTVRPDGTMSDALFKHHMRAPCALRDTRSVPDSPKLVSIATGHHTFAYGPVVLVDPRQGANNDAGIAIVTPGVRVQEGRMAGQPVPGGGVRDRGGLYHTPWALSETCFLVSYSDARPQCTAPGGVDSNGFALYLIDTYGSRELVHRDLLLSCVFPIPLRKRPRPPVLPDARAEDQRVATCYVPDVYDGMAGVARGSVKHIRVSQHVGWPLDPQRGAMHYIPGSAGGKRVDFPSWSPVRVIGTVPVEADGSAHFTVPADVAVYFQALDAKHMEVLRMRSMVSLKAGEVRGCRGCHESQARAPGQPLATPLALRHGPVTPTPPPWGAGKLLGYEWLVQPVLDRHCVRCHGSAALAAGGAKKPDGGLDLSATRARGGLLQSFHSLFGVRPGQKKPGRRLVSISNRFSGAQVTLPKQFGSHRSPLILTLLNDGLHKKEVKLSDAEWLSLVTWVDANAPYHDVFFNKRPADGGKTRRDVRPKFPPFPPPARRRAATVASQP